MSTVINNRNIRRLVRTYIEDINNLPAWLQGIPIGDWDVSRVRDMSNLFEGYSTFNEPLTNWDVSRVTNMFSMFYYCHNFNQPLNHWNVSNVTNMNMMFYNCTNFNQPLGNWDVSRVMDMENMFLNCRNFNQDLSNWNVSNVSNISDMFGGCRSLTINPEWVLRWDVHGYQTMFGHTPLDGTFLRRAPRPQAQPAPQPATQAQVVPQAQPQATDNYNRGQQVEVNVDGVWRPGEVRTTAYPFFTVRNIATGRNLGKEREAVRPEGAGPGVTGANTNIIPGDRVEFQRGTSWRNVLPGILVSKNYLVVVDDRVLTIPHTRLRLATQAAAVVQPRAAVAAERPRHAVAFEVHNVFADLNLDKFMTIIRRENNGASNFKNTQNVLKPLFLYINSEDTTLTPEQKTRYKKNFRKPISGIIDRVNDYISDHPEVNDNTLEVIQFVLSQDPKYKDLYIETFENECMGAYTSGSKESCTKGMWERIYLANKGTIEGLCFDELQGNSSSSASSCKPVYLELYNTFTPGADIDINEIFYRWYNQFSYDAIPEEENPLKNLSVDSRKQHYRDFVRQDRAITENIWNNPDFQKRLENSIKRNEKIFETLDAAAIGGRRSGRQKRRKTMKKRSVRKNKTNKKRR